MAKSIKEKLEDIARREDRLKSGLEEIQKERQSLILPTKSKILGIMNKVLDEFFEHNLEQVLSTRLNADRLSDQFRQLLAREIIERENIQALTQSK